MERRGYKLQEFIAHSSDVNCLALGKKSNRVFITGGEDRKVNLWALGKSTPLLSLSGHASSVDSVAFDSAEILVLAGSSNGTIKLWDLEEAKIVRTLTGHRSNCTSVEFHPFGEFFASGSSDTDLRIWDIRKKGCIHTYKGHTRGIHAIKFTPDGRWVVTGGGDNIVKLWDLTAGKLLHDFKFHTGKIQCIDFHPQEFLLATGSVDRTVKFWDLETFELIGTTRPEASGVHAMIFHPDGRTLFCGLDRILKVLSWEPVRCHDVLDIEWTNLADFSIYEEKLFGCSINESRVGVWVADISLIGPYAVGVLPKSNYVANPMYSDEEDLNVKPLDATAKSRSVLNTGHQDCQTKKPGISNECRQSDQQGLSSCHASNLIPGSSEEFKKNKSCVTTNGSPQRFSSKVSCNSAQNCSTVRLAKPAECLPSFLNGLELTSESRLISLKSSKLSVNISSTLKDPVAEESPFVKDIQPTSGPFSMPVIVPRDTQDHETSASIRKGVSPTKSVKDIHLQSQSLGSCSGRSVGKLTSTVSEPCSSMSYTSNEVNSSLYPRLFIQETLEAEERNKTGIDNVTERFHRMLLDPCSQSDDSKGAEAPCSTSETNKVRYVKGVAVPLGKTRSLVETWEKRERCSNDDPWKKRPVEASEDLYFPEVDIIPEIMMQNHDVFINAVKSRLTKLEVVRHFFEQNGIKGAIHAVAKLPDYSVQVDVLSTFKEKIDLFNLETFSCLLPVLSSLLNSKTERHITLSLEMLLDLVKIFGTVIHSTLSARSVVGVDIQAEQRLQRCTQCFNHLQKIQKMLHSLTRRGGKLAELAEDLGLALQDL